MPREPKLQRWTDLIAALLRRNYTATFEELAKDIPAYQNPAKKKDAIMRMFERDKDELRAFGICIDTIPARDEGDAAGYRIDRKGFYLPYLSLAAHNGRPASSPKKPRQYGYGTLASLVFEPDELQVIAEAAHRVRALGDPVLTEEAESAIRKISFDLPMPRVEETGARDYVAMATAMAERISMPSEDSFALLNEALLRRKKVSFRYRSMSSDVIAERIVEPYGLFFLSSHWYLAGRDVDKDEMRNFRLSRMSGVTVNSARSQSSDYEIPKTFRLQEHARSKLPWELGEGDRNEAIVDFIGTSGAAKAAARLGTSVEGSSDRRKFRFRRIDSFARWLLSFGGEAIPVAPANLVEEFKRQVDQTRAVYGAVQ
jgi:proteasome accessory factor B